MMSYQGRQFKGENRRCKGSETSRSQLIDYRDNFPKIPVLFICLGYILSRFKKALFCHIWKDLKFLGLHLVDKILDMA